MAVGCLSTARGGAEPESASGSGHGFAKCAFDSGGHGFARIGGTARLLLPLAPSLTLTWKPGIII